MLSLLHGKEVASVNVFVDGSCDENLKILLIRELDRKRERVLVLCYSSLPSYYKDFSDKYIFYDGFSDPLNWEAGMTSLNKLEDIHGFISQYSSQNSLLVIDNLVIFGRSIGCIDNNGEWKGLLNILCDLSNRIPIMVFIDPTLADESNIKMLKHIAQFSAELLENQNSFTCKSIMKKKTGKVIEEINLLTMTGNQLIVSKDNTRSSTRKIEEVDPSSNLTFNLNLSSSEKELRAKTKLPYLFDQKTKDSYLNRVNDCPVIYQPDEADDFDEEDPDDDLDI
ncbi:elongator complex protein 5 isoform X1 [Hydra vulgaris]|uniref:elongator complex protein 5 isoform X1 n=1 Tax=Hydra vulgaris TaxID=6087 RepID=UPI00019266E8|nr:elongator complex protein 5 [Hydra vulgaris]XP_012553489.1 elongator complex protein 5 [Hydra vulgaris]